MLQEANTCVALRGSQNQSKLEVASYMEENYHEQQKLVKPPLHADEATITLLGQFNPYGDQRQAKRGCNDL